MPTKGQAQFLYTNINFYIGIIFVCVYGFGCGLIVWNAAFDANPIEIALTKTIPIDSVNSH